MIDTPLVSILMTAFNREQYIAEAIKSVLDSTYQNWELIIVDDCSSDKTVQIAKDFVDKEQRIKVVVNNQNLGDYPNRNNAIGFASGEYIMFVDSDDKILRNGIERCVQSMLLFPNAEYGMYYIEEKGSSRFLPAEEAIQLHFFYKPFLTVGPGGTIIKNSFLKKLNGYPQRYGPANDMYFNLKAVIEGGVVLLPFEFHYYRIHHRQEQNNKYSYLYNNFRYLRDAVLELKLPLNQEQKEFILNKNRRRFLVNSVQYLLKSGNIKKAINAFRSAGYTVYDLYKGIFHYDIPKATRYTETSLTKVVNKIDS